MHTIFHFLLVYTDWQLVTSQDTVHRKYTSDVHLFSNLMGSPSLTENYIVTESAGENGSGATLCFWGTKAGPGIHSGLKWVRSTLSHVDMQSLCICIYVS